MDASPTRVLLIEDDPDDARFVQEALRETAGDEFHVIHSENLAGGIKRLAEGAIDVILLDLCLPDCQGLRALAEVRSRAPVIPVVILSGAPDDREALQQATRQGARDWVCKQALTGRGLVRALRTSIERHKLITAHSQAELRVRRLIESNADGILVVDGLGIVRFANCAASLLLGRPVETLVGELFGFPLVPGDVTELQISRSPSGCAIVEMRVADIDWEGAPACLASLRDITLHKATEEQLARSLDQLARSNAELEQFAYVVSHDLQEPLRMVASYVQLLADRYQDRLDSNANDFISYAVDGAARMKSMITDLLAYSRVDRQGQEFAPIACEAVLTEVCANLQAAITESSATITHDPLPTLLANANQLAHLFQNLIGNAIKFRGQEAPRIHVSAKVKGKEWVFSVRDNGIGLDQQYADRIFMVFQRLHGREEYAGTGIGLAISKKIVEHHGGRIWVESEPGKGATFYFTIPARDPDGKV